MKTNDLYQYIHRHIPVMIILSAFPGLGYIFLGWLNDIPGPAIFWYVAIIVVSIQGYRLYKTLDLQTMSEVQLESWYRKSSFLFYSFFLLWGVIFLLYASEVESGMHYIAIFTEIGASTVAAAILYPDKRLYRPIILLLMIPLVIYFSLVGTWYGYVLTAFAATLCWVLLYAATESYDLFTKTVYQSTHDFLTGLYNRQYFIDYLQKKMNTLKQSGEYSYLMLLDLDHFKTVTDTLGHDIGDKLLQEVVGRIKSAMKPGMIVSRLGGDEFIVTGDNYSSKEECKQVALQISKEILSELKNTYIIKQHHLYISASIGVSLIEAADNNAVEIIKEADIAMYEVKEKGRDGVFLYNEDMSQRVEYNLRMEQLLHYAEDRKQISLA